MDELLRVLAYPRFRRLHGLSDAEIAEYVADVESGALVVPLPGGAAPRVVPGDPTDDVVIATATLGHADAICSRDKHVRQPQVLTHCAAAGLRILDDIELLSVLRSP